MLHRLPFLALLVILFVACTPITPVAPESEPQPTQVTVDQTAAEVPAAGSLKLTILYDNTAISETLQSDWGFAALVEVAGHTVLFDTGAGKDTILLDNMRLLGIDPYSVEAVFLSHQHDDHTQGLFDLLEMGLRPTVYIPAGFSRSFLEEVSAQTTVNEVTNTLEIFPGVHAVVVGYEGTLLVETPEGTVMLVGCAHPGIVRMVTEAQEIVPGDIVLLAGGFHMQMLPEDLIREWVAKLRAAGVKGIMPAHCTGYTATTIFRAEYGEFFKDAGVGSITTF